jgi:hypothetical protein
MADVVDSMTGLIPVVVTGGIIKTFSDSMLSKQGQASSPTKISRKEVVKLVGAKNANLVKKNTRLKLTQGNQEIFYRDGKYWIVGVM